MQLRGLPIFFSFAFLLIDLYNCIILSYSPGMCSRRSRLIQRGSNTLSSARSTKQQSRMRDRFRQVSQINSTIFAVTFSYAIKESTEYFHCDRLDCLRRISKGTADFSVFSAEDLVTAVNTQVEVLLINELRYNKNGETNAVLKTDMHLFCFQMRMSMK